MLGSLETGRNMKVSIFGLGYVGAVTAACFAQRGHHVVGVDVNPDKCQMIMEGRSPIVETGLEELLQAGVNSGHISATVDGAQAVLDTDLSIISVGTPSYANGSHNYAYLYKVCEQIGAAISRKGTAHSVVIRSTVLPGTTDTCIAILEKHAGTVPVHVAFNPEFLREGSAIKDFDHPAYTVIGAHDPKAVEAVKELYSSIDAPVHAVGLRAAEMMKCTANAFHALKITFANEIGQLAKGLGVDGREVMALLCEDKILNISPAYLRPGFAYGGSCLPKDVAALNYSARNNDIDLPLLGSLPQSNRAQIEAVANRVLETGARKIAVLGLAFKPGTDDLRESPAVELVERLIGKGCQIKVVDAAVQHAKLVGANKEYIERKLPHVTSLLVDANAALEGAEAIIVMHGTKEFSNLLAQAPASAKIFDLASLKNLELPAGVSVDGVAW
jgi:GDP-mannose 6-dehydrogenase